MKNVGADASYPTSSLMPTISFPDAARTRQKYRAERLTAAATSVFIPVGICSRGIGRRRRAQRRRVGLTPKRTGSSAGRPVSASAAAIAARAPSSSSVARVERDRDDLGRPGDQRRALVQLDELGERRHREALVVVDDLLAGLVAEHERVRRAAVKQAERDAGVRGMEQRALALDPEQLAAAVDGLRARASRRRRRGSRRRRRRRRSPTPRSRSRSGRSGRTRS